MNDVPLPAAADGSRRKNAGIPRGTRVPFVTLAEAGTGAEVALLGGRGPRVLFLTHEAGCAECERYVAKLAASTERLRDWGARALVIVPAAVDRSGAAAGGGGREIRVLADPESRIAARLDLSGATVLIADEWGEIFFAAEADEGHALPSADEVVDWTRFVSIQCPECEQPEGDWRTVG